MNKMLSTRFMRVGTHLVNLEAVLQVNLRPNGSAELLLQGQKKDMQRIIVPAPAGKELWSFVRENLAIVEFGEVPAEKKAKEKPSKGKKKAQAKQASA